MLPEIHPDGDPFAAQDAAAAASSLLGRMEARARAEADTPPSSALGFAPPKPAAPGKAKPRTSTASTINGAAGGGGGKTGAATLGAGREILIDDSDSEEDEEEEAQMTGDEGGGSGSDEEEDGSGTDAGSEDGEGTPGGAQQEDDDDDDDDESDDDSEDDDASSKGGADVEMGDGEGGKKPKSPMKVAAGATGGAGKDGDVSMKDGEATPDGEQKEKKKTSRKRAPRSPTPPPPAPKPPQPTIRLEIALPPRKGTTAYPEFNIIEMARAKGLIPPEEVKKVEEEKEDSEAEDKGKEGTPGEGGENGAPPKKKRKRGPNVVQGRFGGYDVHDPFVDDSEAQFYEPRFYARPRQEGFFVCSGEVEVAPRRGRVKGSKNKPKFDENGNPIPQPAPRRKSTGVDKVVVGADHKPITASDPSASTSASAAFGATAGAAQEPAKPARKKGEFSPELQGDLDMLKAESDKEPWTVKNKFPPALKELLVSVAYHALDLNEYDDDLFAVMPKIFPYNLFTMKKLIKREVFPKRIEDMKRMQEGYLDTLRKGIVEDLPRQRADFEKKHAEWEVKQREGGGSVTPGFGAAGGLSTPARGATPEPGGPGFGGHASPALMTPLIGGAEAGAEGSPAPGKDDGKNDEPKWRFRFNETMRHALYYACDLEDKMSELIVEKQTLEKATTREVNPEKEYSGKNARKMLYQKICNLWPQDLMNTNQLSREISNYRLKLKRTGELASEAP
ncbi:hypothetical protein JCM11251_004658 [Rhodosporidiobolus azoricus]